MRITALLLTVLFVTACNNSTDTSSTTDSQMEMEAVLKRDYVEGTVVIYDQNSWKTMISDSCKSFFDGCNNCNRMEGSSMAACTRMACAEYQKPECLDERATNADETTAPSRGKRVSYQCDEDKGFMITSGEYVSGDAIVKLQADQIMFSDSQTKTATTMNRTVAALGEKYQAENGLGFWIKGGTATVMQGDVNLYQNCEAV